MNPAASAAPCILPWCTSTGAHDIHQNRPALVHGVTMQIVRWGTTAVKVYSNAIARADLLSPAQQRSVHKRLELLADTAEASNIALGLSPATGGAR